MQRVEFILKITLSIILALSIMGLVGQKVPWYTMDQPLKVDGKIFYPGDKVRVNIHRRTLIGFEARITRELVRVHEGKEEEVSSLSYYKEIDPSPQKRNIVVFYEIPSISMCPQMKPNTYFFRGVMTFKPMWNIEKTYHYRTENFQIRLKRPGPAGKSKELSS